jgi:hypothetical protein
MNIERLITEFDNGFIDNQISIYNQYIDFLNKNHPVELYKNNWAIPFFRQFGRMDCVYPPFYERNKNLDVTIFVHFRNTIFSPNISLLDYVLDNYDTFKDLNFLDFACGLGTLSIFLKKININCFNYDTNTEIGFSTLDYEDYKKYLFTHFYNKKSSVKINDSKNKIDSNYDCLVCMGYYVDYSFINSNCKYLFLDKIYNNDFTHPHFSIIHDSSELIVLKKIV